MEDIQYDSYGRVMYHPEYHFAHGKPFTEEKLHYLCKYHEIDEMRSIAMALGKTEMTLKTRLRSLRKSGEYEYYKNLDRYW